MIAPELPAEVREALDAARARDPDYREALVEHVAKPILADLAKRPRRRAA